MNRCLHTYSRKLLALAVYLVEEAMSRIRDIRPRVKIVMSRIRDIRPRVKYVMSRIRDYRPMSVNEGIDTKNGTGNNEVHTSRINPPFV